MPAHPPAAGELVTLGTATGSGQDIDTIEEDVFSPAITDDSQTIYLLKRENLELWRAVAPWSRSPKHWSTAAWP